MRYRIVREGKLVPNRPAPTTAVQLSVVRAPAPVHGRMFEPLPWPGTTRDVAWSSTPTFQRSPAGWCRVGFFA